MTSASAPSSKPSDSVAISRRPGELALAAALMILGAGCSPGDTPAASTHKRSAQSAAIAEVTTILRVAGVKATLQRKGDSGFVDAEVGRALPPGTVLRAGKGVRARIVVRDQRRGSRAGSTVLSLNEGSELTIDGLRALKLVRGEVYAEVAHDAEALVIKTPAGPIRVTGTKLDVKVAGDKATVDVSRGTVEVGEDGRRLAVGAGERAKLSRGRAPRVGTPGDLSALTRWAREALSTPKHSGASKAGFGSLTARIPGTRRARPLELRAQTVRVTIRDNIARTEIEQRFYNPTGRTLEGRYRFPLPTGASISRLALQVGKKLEEGEIVERRRAQRIFQKIVSDTIRPRDPALLEWVGGRTFRMRIFPIAPRSERRVIITYTQPLSASFGRYRYVYPMDGGNKSTRVGNFKIAVDVAHSRGLRALRAPLYPVLREKNDGGERLSYEASDFRPRASFVVGFASGSAPELAVATFAASKQATGHTSPAAGSRRRKAGIKVAIAQQAEGSASKRLDRAAFFSAVFRPELPRAVHGGKRDLLLLVDASYSARHTFKLARAAVAAFLAELDLTRTRFNVIACDARCKVMGKGFRKPDAGARRAARRFLGGIEPGGSSDIQLAMARAAALIKASSSLSSGADSKTKRHAHVLYIGDGRPTAGELRSGFLARRVVTSLRAVGAELSALQIGEDAEGLFLSAAARRLGGRVYRVSGGEDIEKRVLAVASALYRPSLTDITLDFEGLSVDAVYPRHLPTLAAGSEVNIVGRFRGAGKGVLRVRGRVGGKAFERRYPLELKAGDESKVNSFIPRIWAKRRIDALTLDDYDKHRRDIVRLSKRYTVLSRATALLVLENERMYREFGVKRKRNRHYWKGDKKIASKTSRDAPAKKDKKTKAKGTAVEVGGAGKAADGAAVRRGTRASASSRADAPKLASAAPRGEGSSFKGRGPRSSKDTSSGRPAQPPATSTPSVDSLGDRRVATEREKNSQKAQRDENKAGDDDAPATKSRPRVARKPPTRRPQARARKKYKRSSRRWRGRYGVLGGGGGGGYYHSVWRWIDSSRIRPADGRLARRRRAAAARRLARLQASLAAHPLRRTLHRALHRAAVQAGALDVALAHARKWVALEGRRLEALRALGDARAAAGEGARAMRVYASMVDVNSWRTRTHRELAKMYRRKGDLRRACSHRWSLVSLRPQSFSRYASLARCLSAAGEGALSRSVLDEVGTRRLSRSDKRRLAKLRAIVERGALSLPRMRAYRRLRLSASWDGGVDLDLALQTPYGRRIGAYGSWRGGIVRDSRDGLSAETLGYHARNGSYQVEITRAAPSSKPVRGTVVVRIGRRVRTVPFVLAAGQTSKAIAMVRVHRQHRLVPYR